MLLSGVERASELLSLENEDDVVRHVTPEVGWNACPKCGSDKINTFK